MIETKNCQHWRCNSPALQLTILDDHDSNAGVYQLTDFYSVECALLQLKHHAENGRPLEVKEILSILKRFEIA